MIVQVRLFAILRERVGRPTLELELPDGARVADALERVREIAGEVPAVMAVNRIYASADQELHAGDELALIPPVSGGETAGHVLITEEPLSIEALAARVGDSRAGAVVVFCGVTREVAALDYEAYVEMATEQIEQLVAAALQRHALTAAAVEHRIGRVPLGEPSVVVAVSAPHREAAFAGARELIDELKARAPIWKREEGADWVAGTLPDNSDR
jgi:molybdopterin synthase catalytic subunit